MSLILYFATKTLLKNTEYSADEVFANTQYPDSLYCSDGVLLDNNLDSDDVKRLGKLYDGYNWYIFKAIVLPFQNTQQIKDFMPDYFYCAQSITKWFISFIQKLLQDGNETCLIQLWDGDVRCKKYKTKSFNLATFDIDDSFIEYDILYKFNQ